MHHNEKSLAVALLDDIWHRVAPRTEKDKSELKGLFLKAHEYDATREEDLGTTRAVTQETQTAADEPPAKNASPPSTDEVEESSSNLSDTETEEDNTNVQIRRSPITPSVSPVQHLQ